MLDYIDNKINSIAMYRLVVYGLGLITLFSLMFSVFALIDYPVVNLIASLVFFVLAGYFINKMLAGFLKLDANFESWLITALILYLIMPPAVAYRDFIPLFFSILVGIGSKFVFKLNNAHLFNPAAIGAVFVSLLGISGASWWVATPWLFPIVLLTGFAIARKIRKLKMVAIFVITAYASAFVQMYMKGITPDLNLIYELTFSWPIFFLGLYMLTEPLTTPSKNVLQLIYAAIVGILFGLKFNWFVLYSTPELALCMANLYSFLVSPKQKFVLTLIEKNKLSRNIFEFVFKPSKKLNFIAGQYLEWTLDHNKIDSRGNRRYFTIASSPTEDNIKLAVKVFDNPSSFKSSLVNLEKSDQITVSHLSGEFILPVDSNQKLIFVSGGIGVTPFRSMIKYLLDSNQKRDIVHFYLNNMEDDIAYKSLFDEAESKLGIKTVYVLSDKEKISKTWKGESGYLTEEIVKKYLTDVEARTVFISGPSVMVNVYKKLFSQKPLKASRIVTDYFPGF